MPEKRKFTPAYEFSPGQVDLKRVLELVVAANGDRKVLKQSVRLEYFREAAQQHKDDPERMLVEQLKRAGNVLIGLKGYGLMGDDARLTPVGVSILGAPDGERAAMFARHILKANLGMDLLGAISSLQQRGTAVDKKSLSAELRREGFNMTTATTHHTMMAKWLREGGVLRDYEIQEDVVKVMTGTTPGTVDEWKSLDGPARAFATELRRLAPGAGQQISAQSVTDAARRAHGDIFPDDHLRKKVLTPLAEAGWIELPPREKGRGSRSGTVAATEKLLGLDLASIGALTDSGIPAELRKLRTVNIDSIYRDLALKGDDGAERHRKGIALELLALRIAEDLDLQPVHFRIRGTETGGKELDLVAEGIHLHFTRWLFQCKNTGTATVADLAQEIGNAALLHAHVVVLICNGKPAPSLIEYAAAVTATGHIQAYVIDDSILEQYRRLGPSALVEHFRRQAREASDLKRVQLGRGPRSAKAD